VNTAVLNLFCNFSMKNTVGALTVVALQPRCCQRPLLRGRMGVFGGVLTEVPPSYSIGQESYDLFAS
jgi:hypothetical protein